MFQKVTKELKKNKVLKAGIGYTIGNYFLKGLGFITVPIFSRLMAVSDYGIYNTFLSYEGMLYLFIGLALHSSIKNAKYKYGDERLDSFTSSITIFPLIISCIALIMGNLFLPVINKFLSIGRVEYNLLIILCLCSSLLYVYQSRLVLEYNSKSYMKMSYFNALSSVAMSIILMLTLFKDQKYLGRICGSVIPMSILAVWILYSLYSKARPKRNKEYWKFALKISLPIIPHGVGQIILSSFDRVMITNYIGSTAAGLYSLAYTIYSIILVAGDSISTVYEPWAYEQFAEKRYDIVRKRSTIYIVLLAVVCSGAMLIAPELVRILGSQKYVDAIPAVTPILGAGFFAMAYNIPSTVEYYYGKTSFIAVGTVLAAVLNVATNAIFIPQYGYLAAAYTTLGSYMVYFIFHCIIAHRIIGQNIFSIKVLLTTVAGVSVIGVISLYYQNNYVVRYSFAAAVVVVVLVWLKKGALADFGFNVGIGKRS